jgi:hypothetical protein
MASREKKRGEPYTQWINLDPQKIQKQITKWKFTYIAHCNEPLIKEENDSQKGEEYSKYLSGQAQSLSKMKFQPSQINELED